MPIYVTKYSLASGKIEVCEKAPYQAENEAKYCIVKWPGGLNGVLFLSKPDWHTTLEDARGRCDTMRKAKIESLKKQIKKLDGMTFQAIEVAAKKSK